MNIAKDILFVILALFILPFNTIGQDSLVVAFGSCSKAEKDQTYWSVIGQQTPDAWIWLGDIVYADSNIPKVLKKKYRELERNPHYREFKKQTTIYGVWDDHDYGKGDGGKSYVAKAESRDILYDFLDIPGKSPIRERSGAYQSYRVGNDKLSLRLILLDVRYFRDDLEKNTKGSNRYVPDEKAEMLGDDQWEWLEMELQNAKEDVIVIGSGTQVIPVDHPYEKWADYPTERKRLLDLLASHSDKRMVLLSGDRHMAEVSAIAASSDLFLYEITSSGLTHSYETGGGEVNNFRIRNLCTDKNFGTLSLITTGEAIRVVGTIYRIDGQVFDEYIIYNE